MSPLKGFSKSSLLFISRSTPKDETERRLNILWLLSLITLVGTGLIMAVYLVSFLVAGEILLAILALLALLGGLFYSGGLISAQNARYRLGSWLLVGGSSLVIALAYSLIGGGGLASLL